MGEEEKKVEQEETKKPEEEKKPAEEEKKIEESKEPPPPQDIVLRVYMHCEGCARKVRKCLRGFQGVEDVQTDCKTHKVVVKGEKADPLKVLGVLQRKCHKQVELVSPIPKPPTEEEKKSEENKKNVKPEEKKEEIITVVLRVHMHCDACAQKIQKYIQRMIGVESANADMKSSLVTVKGAFDPQKLVEYVYKKTGKRSVIVKTEPEKKEEKSKEEKKGEEEEKKENKGGEAEKKEGEDQTKQEGSADKADGGGGVGEETKVKEAEEETKVVAEVKTTHELYYHPVQYNTEYVYLYPPQMFSDENPNACTVM